MKKISIIFSAIAILISSVSAMAGIINCSSGTTCQISVYLCELPNQLSKYTLQMIPPVDGSGNPVSIPAGNSVEFKYKGVSAAIVCDNTWQTLPPVALADEIQNSIKCIVSSSRTQVNVYLKVHDQNTYTNIYSSPPSYTYSELNNADETSPVCTEDNALAASAGCKWQKQNANNSVLNEQGVPLNYWVVYARTAVNGLIMGYSVDSEEDASQFESSDNVCAVDLNVNGNVDLGEMQACIQIDEVQFCPVDAVECIATHSEAICPSGSVLNADTDKCEASPNISCPSGGYAYNSDIDTCAMDVACPDGGGLNPNSDLCEIVVTSDLCPAGYTYKSNLDACTKTVVCAEGGTYNSSADKCEISYTPVCSDGYVYNSSIQKCERNPVCPSGSNYNNTYNKCLKAVSSTTCPAGYTYNSTAKVCEKAPDCPSGSSYNTSTDRCERAKVSGTCSVSGELLKCKEMSFGCTSSSSSCCHIDITCNSDSSGTIKYYDCCSPQGGLKNTTTATTSQLLNGIAINCGGSNIKCSSDGSCKFKFYNFYCSNPCSGWYLATNSFTLDSMATYACSFGTGGTYYDLSSCEAGCKQCPSGYTEVGGICVVNVSCPSGGTLNAGIDKCQYTPTYNCDSGFTYDSAIGYCKINATCPDSGTLDTSVDKCQLTFTRSCPADYNYDSSTDKCESDPVCDYGYFDGLIDLCRLSASEICPSAYTYNNTQNKCLVDPSCLSGASYSTTLNQCSIGAIHDCPGNMSYSSPSRLCEAYPMCEVGAYDPGANSCYEGNNTCPYGTQYPCLEYQGKNHCSAQECVEYGGATETGGDPAGANDKQDDGQYNEDGACLGQIYVFNGNDRRCRSDGLTIAFANCCQDEDYLFGLGQCKQEEIQLAKLKGRGLCHEIGEYCSKTLDLLFTEICIEHSKSYCCFNSKLSRIVHEQGRPQMSTDINNWGSPEGPFCRGFIPEEFQMLDFSRIDLSEWYGDIVPTAQGQVENNMQQSVQRFYDKVN